MKSYSVFTPAVDENNTKFCIVTVNIFKILNTCTTHTDTCNSLKYQVVIFEVHCSPYNLIGCTVCTCIANEVYH